jgi:2-polyprenyl-3-methyl-5-hydroxy-6-metoxy-1,4-benzoquinol methylase
VVFLHVRIQAMSTPASAGPDPGLIFDALCAFQQTEALKAAVELDIFTHIAEGASTAAEIAQRAQSSERGMRILCDFMTIRGFLCKTDGHYSNSPTAQVFLNKRSPACIGSMANFLAHPRLMECFHDLAASVRKGGTVSQGTLAPEDPVWVEFARSMAPFIGLGAQAVGKIVARPGEAQKVLDISAGHGLFGLMVAQGNSLAQIYAADWANVLEVARENAAKLGASDRFHTIPGSAFDSDLGTGYDLVLVPNFLHHFDIPTCVTFLKKLRGTMKPGATLAIVEFVPNEDRISPPMAASFSLQMLGGTDAGDAFTFRELSDMVSQAGFKECRQQPLAPSPEMLVLAQN